MTQAMPESHEPPLSSDLPVPGPASALAPTAGAQRIVAIDVLRGVVLLGILVMNIPFMGWPVGWVFESLKHRDDTAIERGLWLLTEMFANQRMMSIFSLLFGAGIVLVAERAVASGRSAAGLHYKRMGWLLLIGLIHAYLFWYGDILVAYALVGSLVFLLRKVPVRWLVPLGLVALAVPVLLSLGFAGLMALWAEHDPAEYAKFEMYPAEMNAAEVVAYRGGLWSQFQARWPMAAMIQLMVGPIMIWWWAGGMMLLGMAAMKSRLITGQLPTKVYAALLALGFGVGLPLSGLVAWGKLAGVFDSGVSHFLGEAARMPLALVVAGGWVGLVMLLCKQVGLARLLHPLSCVGRMALTNYLSQTLVVTFIFYGHGLGQFAKLERPAMFAIVMGVWAAQLVWSPLWLRFFRFGPMEWLWRSLTYLRLEPMRKRAAVAGGA